MPRENKYVKKDDLIEYVNDMGAVLEYNRSVGVFYIFSRHDVDNWVWVINPHTNERVRKLRELEKFFWYRALDEALNRLSESSRSRATQQK